ncbi:MAG: hypothetical protein LBI14_00340 [Treponema sp.]|nr:hypothetical protein [Treponema sp.]
MKFFALLLVFFPSLSEPVFLFPLGKEQEQPPPVERRVISDLQDRYDALVAPGIIMLPAGGISAVSPDLLAQIENELFRQLVNGGKIKPVRMQRWLLSTYTNKANNPFTIMNAIRNEQYILPLQYMGKPVVFRNGAHHYLALYIYSLETYYPLIIFRHFIASDSLEDVIASCIDELHARLSQRYSGATRKRIVIDAFKLEFFRLAEHSSGEFDFIPAPFLELEGMTLRDGDDFFSRMMEYVLASTNLFQTFPIEDFREYSNAVVSASNPVDYRIQGRVQLSEYECVIYVDVLDVRSGGARVVSLRQPLLSYSFDGIWNAYRFLSVQIIEKLFEHESYGIVPKLESPGRSFFSNGMFIGWDTLENFVLARGLHVISTGSPLRIEHDPNLVNSYHVLLDNHAFVYTDTEGNHIWNLLQK